MIAVRLSARELVGLLAIALVSLSGLQAIAADPPGGFYQGKRMTLFLGTGPGGGGYDTYARLLGRHLGQHIAGAPAIVAQNRPGAGGLTMANELYNTAPADGTAIGVLPFSLHIQQMMDEPGVRFDANQFLWIGRLADAEPLIVVRADSPAQTIEDAKTREVLIGIPGVGSASVLSLFATNNILGTKFKLISGYQSGSEIRLAVERGEIHGTMSVLWGTNADWIRQNKLTVMLRAAPRPYPGLDGVPTLVDFARNDDERRVLRLFSSYTELGQSFAAPPKTPMDRVMELRQAFLATAADPALRADANKMNIELAVLSGEEVQKLVAQAMDLPGDLRARAIAATKGNAVEKTP